MNNATLHCDGVIMSLHLSLAFGLFSTSNTKEAVRRTILNNYFPLATKEVVEQI